MSICREGEEGSTEQLCRKENLYHHHDLSLLSNCYLVGRVPLVSPHVDTIIYLHPTKILIRLRVNLRIGIHGTLWDIGSPSPSDTSNQKDVRALFTITVNFSVEHSHHANFVKPDLKGVLGDSSTAKELCEYESREGVHCSSTATVKRPSY